MNLLPDRNFQQRDWDPSQTADAEVIDAEIVGEAPPPIPWWKRFLLSMVLIAFMWIIGLGLCVVGLAFTLTIIGAAIGIPMIAAGVLVLVMSALLILGAGRIKIN